MLKSFCAEQPDTWPQMLQQVMFAYRTSKSRVTGHSPHFLHTGQIAKQPMDLIFGTFPHAKFESQNEYAYDLFKKMHKTYRWVENNLKASRDLARQRYDNRTKVKPFKPGDWVYIWRPRKKGQHTFASNFYGPFKILKLVGDYVYKIDTGTSRIHDIVPHDLLRLEPNGENVTTKHYDPVDELEWDHQYQFPMIEETEFAEFREQPLDDDDRDTRPLIMVEGTAQPDNQRPVRNRRPPDRYPGYLLQ